MRPGSTTTCSARLPTATRRCASPSTSTTTAGASATSPSATRPPRGAGAPADHFQARFSWADVERLKTKFKIPFILKGIATAEDARIAVEHGIEGVYVSNHGGRQLDHGKGGMAVLPEVVEAVAGRAEVIVDGGFLRGADIVKAMALGANAVGIGRLQGLALGAGGVGALVRALELLRGRDAPLPGPPRRHLVRGARSQLRRARRAASRARAGTAPSRC